MHCKKSQIREWIIDKKRIKEADHLQSSTPLLENKILKSVDIMDLMIFIEFMRNEPLDIRELTPGVFHSIDTIVDNFFPPETA